MWKKTILLSALNILLICTVSLASDLSSDALNISVKEDELGKVEVMARVKAMDSNEILAIMTDKDGRSGLGIIFQDNKPTRTEFDIKLGYHAADGSGVVERLVTLDMNLSQQQNKHILWNKVSIFDIQKLFLMEDQTAARVYTPTGTKVIKFSLKNSEKYKEEVNDMLDREIMD